MITTIAGDGTFGTAGDNGPATTGEPRGPGRHRARRGRGGPLTVFIADYYNGPVRAVGPDGIMRNVSGEGRVEFGAPTRVAFDAEQRMALRRRREQRPGGRAQHSRSAPEPRGHAARAAPRPRPERRADVPRTQRPASAVDAVVSPARTAAASSCWPCCSCSRSGLARCSRGRSRSSSTTCCSGGRSSRRPHRAEQCVGALPSGRAEHSSLSSTPTAASRCRAVVIAGIVLQMVNQFVSAYGTQVQVDTGQRMVYDLRLSAVRAPAVARPAPPHHDEHGDAVYRVDIDAYSIENLVDERRSSRSPRRSTTLVVMFGILLRLNRTIALLSLTVVPFLFLCLRYYTSTLSNREERVKELESKLLERLYETFGAMRLVKSFAREPYELGRYAAAGEQTMDGANRDHVAAVAVCGRRQHDHDSRHRAVVIVVGGVHVMTGQMTRRRARPSSSLPRRGLRPAVVDRPHDRAAPGRHRGRAARARDVRAHAGNGRTAGRHRRERTCSGDIRFEDVGFSYPDGTRCCTTSRSTQGPGRWSRSSASRAPARRRSSA